MKIFKRIIAVFLVILTVVVVGYMVHTCSRLPAGAETDTEITYEYAEED